MFGDMDYNNHIFGKLQCRRPWPWPIIDRTADRVAKIASKKKLEHIASLETPEERLYQIRLLIGDVIKFAKKIDDSDLRIVAEMFDLIVQRNYQEMVLNNHQN